MLFLRPLALLKTDTLVTSLPVPAVVPIRISGSLLFSHFWPYSSSSVSAGLCFRQAMTFAASSGEPPPIPITQVELLSGFAASRTEATSGFSLILSYMTYSLSPMTLSTSSNAPESLALFFPQTIRYLSPSERISSPLFNTTSLSYSTLTLLLFIMSLL